jgi:hypothetical protein
MNLQFFLERLVYERDIFLDRLFGTDRERRTFIRRAAIAFASAVDAGPINHDSCGHSCLMAKPDEAWALARALWDAKPEDC